MASDWMNLPEQFLVCRDLGRVPDGWMVHTIGDWHLGYHPTLPVTTLTVGDRPVGWMLGYPIDSQGRLLGNERLPLPMAAAEVESRFETWVYDHGGRFVALLIVSDEPRVYIDPIGSLSLVYCPSLEAVGSTVTVIPREGDTGELTDLVRVVGIPRSSMYPLQYTPRKNVWRLVPNHTLHLNSWQVHRHWPMVSIPQVHDLSEATSELITRVRTHTRALLDGGPVLMRLTAGLDSRTLLACVRPWIDKITVFTAEHEKHDEHSWLDCSTAEILARRLALKDYRRLLHQPARQEHLEEWLVRTGWNCGEERGWRAVTTYKQLPPQCADLIALVGEVARGFFWRPEDDDKTIITVERLASRFAAGRTPEGLAAIAAWLENVPTRDPFLILDLFFMEQRLGGWAGLFPYGYADAGRFHIFPMLHRRVIETMLALPPRSLRGTDQLARRVMQQEWPELLEYPFNRAQGTQRVKLWWVRRRRDAHELGGKLVRGLRDPLDAVRRIRRRFSCAKP